MVPTVGAGGGLPAPTVGSRFGQIWKLLGSLCGILGGLLAGFGASWRGLWIGADGRSRWASTCSYRRS